MSEVPDVSAIAEDSGGLNKNTHISLDLIAGHSYILPFKQGMDILNLLQNGVVHIKNYSTKDTIGPINNIGVSFLTTQQLNEIRVACMLESDIT